jgi:hypothetical protein
VKGLIVLILLAAIVATPALPVSAADTISGKNVTVGQSSPMRAFLRVGKGAEGTTHFDAWEDYNGEVVRKYDVDMTKLMHMIVVSDDLADFQHVHPVLLADGHFVIDVRLAEPSAKYHVYFDGLPSGAGRHVFRFDVPGLDSASRRLHAAGSSANVGPYTVVIDPTTVPIGEISTIAVRILKHGKPATDLHPYLGVMAHGVLIGTTDLAYMHVHGMTSEMLDMASGANDCGDGMMMAMTPMPPDLNIGNQFEFQILAPSSQPYDFWLQFVGGKTLYTAPLLVTTI